MLVASWIFQGWGERSSMIGGSIAGLITSVLCSRHVHPVNAISRYITTGRSERRERLFLYCVSGAHMCTTLLVSASIAISVSTGGILATPIDELSQISQVSPRSSF